jgi:exopolysaccharide biosynthesis polyprenyl glycosylphosphotransferase
MLTVPEKKLILFATDLTVLALVAAVALLLTATLSPFRGEELFPQAASIVMLGFLLLLTGYLNETLDVECLRSSGLMLKKWAQAWFVGVGLFAAGYFLLGVPWGAGHSVGLKITRFAPLIFAVLLLFALPLGRMAIAKMMGLRRNRRTCVVAGAGAAAREFLTVNNGSRGDWNVVCLGDDDPCKADTDIEGHRVTAKLIDLPEIVSRHRASDVILAISGPLRKESLDAVMQCFEKGLEVLTVPQALERACGRIPIHTLGEKWLPGTFWSTTDRPLIQRVVKRSLDLTVALILLVILLPLMLALALALLATQGLPLLYRQERVGRAGQNFTLFKLRTMKADAENDGPQWAAKDDRRVTKLGRWLRRARLDEVPQLWNVLRGDMSLVGPRPERLEFVSQLETEIPFYRARFAIKPGLTGWAQIKSGYASGTEGAKTKLEYDLYYIKNRSLWLDTLILLQTVRVVLGLQGR